MYKQAMEFAVTRKNGVITQVGKSSVAHPEIKFQRGDGVKWYKDKPKGVCQIPGKGDVGQCKGRI